MVIKKYLIVSFILHIILNSVYAQDTLDKKKLSIKKKLIGIWKAETGNTKIKYTNDSMYVFINQNIINKESYSLKKDSISGEKLFIIVYSENEYSQAYIFGLTDSTLSLQNQTGGPALYRRLTK